MQRIIRPLAVALVGLAVTFGLTLPASAGNQVERPHKAQAAGTNIIVTEDCSAGPLVTCPQETATTLIGTHLGRSVSNGTGSVTLDFTAPPCVGTNGADGTPVITYLKPAVFEDAAAMVGVDGGVLHASVFYGLGPNDVAAWPSLHVAYPFLAVLFLLRAFGRIAYLALAYTLLVGFSVVYTGDHWVHDCIVGAAYAYIAYYAIVHTPASIREAIDRAFTSGGRSLAGEAS